MNSRLLMLTVILIGFSSLLLLLVVYDTPPPPPAEPVMEARPDLKEVVHADTSCSIFWRVELSEM